MVFEDYVSVVMAFREYVICGYKANVFLHREGAVLGGLKWLRKKINVHGASSWTVLRPPNVHMWKCGYG